MLLLIDNFDSFTYNLADYLGRLGANCQVFRNDMPLERINQLQYKGIVLSPGPGTPQAAGNLMKVIEHYADTHPILGICLGHQALGSYFGAKLNHAARPMHGKISTILTKPDSLFTNLPTSFDVVRYHSLVLQDLPAVLHTTAYTTAGEIMAFTHQTKNIKGIQFHPEAALSEHGLSILKNWLDSL